MDGKHEQGQCGFKFDRWTDQGKVPFTNGVCSVRQYVHRNERKDNLPKEHPSESNG